ncbi:hypothetical protein, partial [Streptococcus anginosus]|uniref:hypothetical protein n=1 Tax=Streptococcus anginosus TaxID=1328 RepID=UPI0021F83D70
SILVGIKNTTKKTLSFRPPFSTKTRKLFKNEHQPSALVRSTGHKHGQLFKYTLLNNFTYLLYKSLGFKSTLRKENPLCS